ncbi:MAG: hypothetical protein EBX84_04485 [Candidatus Fonsibacter lacus]|nr:hypothetical protein [Candidatus Fonsibacter lacus]
MQATHDCYLDFKGMNQRLKPPLTPIHNANLVEVNANMHFCLPCENIGSRTNRSIAGRKVAAIQFHTKKLGRSLSKLDKRQWYQDL